MRDGFLDQSEVDALLEEVNEVDQAHAVEEENAPVAGAYNLASQERIVRGRMPTMEIINERFVRSLRIGMYNLIRRTPDVSVRPVKVHKYSAFLRDLPVPTNFNIVTVRPLRGNALFVLDPSLVFAVIEALFGGKSKYQARIEGREFTPTELRIIRRLVYLIIDEYIKAWKGIYPLSMEYQRSEMLAQFATIAGPSEIVISTTFSLDIGNVSGKMHICIPYSTFEPIRDLLYSSTQGDSLEVDQRWVNMLSREIQAAEVTLVAELAKAQLTVAQLMAMRTGDFIELDRPEHVIASVGGVPLLQCQFGTHSDKYALRVERSLALKESNLFGE